MMDYSLLYDPADMADMIERSETLADRWDQIVEAVASTAGVGRAAAEHVVTSSGFTPSGPELCSLEVCAAIVDGSVHQILVVVGRVTSGITVH